MISEKLLGFRALYFDLQVLEKSFCTSTEGPRPCAEPEGVRYLSREGCVTVLRGMNFAEARVKCIYNFAEARVKPESRTTSDVSVVTWPLLPLRPLHEN